MGNSPTGAIPVSNFYLACCSGDVDKVKRILPTMKLKEISRVESNGSTALHAAAGYGHFEIVELLLKYGCSTTTINSDGKTAVQECEDERICQLIQSLTIGLNNSEDMNSHTPKSCWCQIYENIDNQDKTRVATKIMKLRLRTYLINQFKTNEIDRINRITKIVLQNVHPSDCAYQSIVVLLEKFAVTKMPQFLITICTLKSHFYNYLQHTQDNVFIMELFISLMVFKERFFSGYAYRGVRLEEIEIDYYRWAWHHRTSFIEIHSITSASASRSVAERFAREKSHNENTISTLFILHFTQSCETAVDLRRKSNGLPNLCKDKYQDGVLIIPGTFFEVTSISQSSDCTIIELENIPVSCDMLVKTINELK